MSAVRIQRGNIDYVNTVRGTIARSALVEAQGAEVWGGWTARQCLRPLYANNEKSATRCLHTALYSKLQFVLRHYWAIVTAASVVVRCWDESKSSTSERRRGEEDSFWLGSCRRTSHATTHSFAWPLHMSVFQTRSLLHVSCTRVET